MPVQHAVSFDAVDAMLPFAALGSGAVRARSAGCPRLLAHSAAP
eukprot:gene10206-9359_t